MFLAEVKNLRYFTPRVREYEWNSLNHVLKFHEGVIRKKNVHIWVNVLNGTMMKRSYNSVDELIQMISKNLFGSSLIPNS